MFLSNLLYLIIKRLRDIDLHGFGEQKCHDEDIGEFTIQIYLLLLGQLILALKSDRTQYSVAQFAILLTDLDSPGKKMLPFTLTLIPQRTK